jgi:predicted transglutaminase-like cysteine proteinase
MGMRVIIAAAAAMLSTAAQAQPQHAIETDEPVYQPAGMREVCSTMNWGVGEIRTDCRYEALLPERANPALKGICTTYYGRRTCH